MNQSLRMLLAVLAVVAFRSEVWAQSSPPPPPSKTVSAPDKLSVMSLTVTQTFPFDFTMVVKNVSSATLVGIDLLVTNGSVIAGHSVVPTLAPGATAELKGSLRAPLPPGSYTVVGKASFTDKNTIEINVANNERAAVLTIPVPPSTNKNRAYLNVTMAKNAGARFEAVPVPGYGLLTTAFNFSSIAVSQRLSCTPAATGLINAPCEVSGVFLAYQGFRLKNGWKVISYSVNVTNVPGGWTWTPPRDDDPSYRMVVFQSGSMVAATYAVDVMIEIEGPANTSPY